MILLGQKIWRSSYFLLFTLLLSSLIIFPKKRICFSFFERTNSGAVDAALGWAGNYHKRWDCGNEGGQLPHETVARGSWAGPAQERQERASWAMLWETSAVVGTALGADLVGPKSGASDFGHSCLQKPTTRARQSYILYVTTSRHTYKCMCTKTKHVCNHQRHAEEHNKHKFIFKIDRLNKGTYITLH